MLMLNNLSTKAYYQVSTGDHIQNISMTYCIIDDDTYNNPNAGGTILVDMENCHTVDYAFHVYAGKGAISAALRCLADTIDRADDTIDKQKKTRRKPKTIKG